MCGPLFLFVLYSICYMCYTSPVAKLGSARVDALVRTRAELLHQLSSLSGLLAGSSFERFSICSRPACRCHEGERHGPRLYVTTTHGKKQVQHYVPQEQRRAVLDGIRQYGRLLRIVEKVTALNLTLMRGGMLDEYKK